MFNVFAPPRRSFEESINVSHKSLAHAQICSFTFEMQNTSTWSTDKCYVLSYKKFCVCRMCFHRSLTTCIFMVCLSLNASLRRPFNIIWFEDLKVDCSVYSRTRAPCPINQLSLKRFKRLSATSNIHPYSIFGFLFC